MAPAVGAIVALTDPVDVIYGVSVGDLGVVKGAPNADGCIGVEFGGGSKLILDPLYVNEIKHLRVDGFVCSAINWQSQIKVGDVGIVRRVCAGDYDRQGVRRVNVDFGHGLALNLQVNQTRAAPRVFGRVGSFVYSTIDWKSLKEGDQGIVKGLSSDREAMDRVEVKFDSFRDPINMKDTMLRLSNPPPRQPLDSMSSLEGALADIQRRIPPRPPLHPPIPESTYAVPSALADIRERVRMANLMNNPSSGAANSQPDLRTEDVTLISHTHGRERRAERNILRVELQRAIKYGIKEPANPGRDGSRRWSFTYDGVVYITDETCRHEVTSWRVDGNDKEAIAPAEVELAGTSCHAVLIVDNSGSMRKKDVQGKSRAAAVYDSLVKDYVREQLKISAAKDDVVTLILMSDNATVIVKAHPLNQQLIGHIEKMKRRHPPGSHGNYIPALDKALEVMTEDAPNRGSILLLMFSDGAPSDHTCMECEHGVQVFQIDRKEDPKMQHRSKASAWACRKRLQERVKKDCLQRVKRIGQVFGRDRVISRMVGFGPSNEDFDLLSEMAAALPRGEFQRLGLNGSNLKTSFSSLSSSMTELRTGGGSCALTPRPDIVVDKNQKIDSSSDEVHEQDGWFIYSHEHFLGKFRPEIVGGKTKLSKLALGSGATGLAFMEQPFEQGAERVVFRCTEIEIPDDCVDAWWHDAKFGYTTRALKASWPPLGGERSKGC